MASGGPPCSNFLHHISQETQRFIYLTWIRNLLNKFLKPNFHLPEKLFYPLPLETYTLCFWLQVPAPRHWSMQRKFRRVSEALWTDGLSEPERPRHRGWNDVPRPGFMTGWVFQYRLTVAAIRKWCYIMCVCACYVFFYIRYWGMWSYMFPIHWSMKKEGYPPWFTIILGKHGVALWYEQSVTDNHRV